MKKELLISITFVFLAAFSLAKPPVKTNADTGHVVLLKQIDVTKYLNNSLDQFSLINDSIAIIGNGNITTVNPIRNIIIRTVTTNDSILAVRLFALGNIPKKLLDSVLALRHLPTNIYSGEYNHPLGFSNYYYDGQNVWLGVHLSVELPTDENTSVDFLIKYNQSLTEIKKIYSFPSPKDIHDYLWEGMYYPQIITDSNTVYSIDCTNPSNPLLDRYFLNDKTNRGELRKECETKYPDELERASQGVNLIFVPYVKTGFQNNSIYMFCKGMYVYGFDDNSHKNLSPGLAEWGSLFNVNTITDYDYFPAKQQAFLILHKENIGLDQQDSIPVEYYYCYLNKNYQPIERQPEFFVRSLESFTNMPDGTLQVVTEDNGKSTLKIYKVF